MWDAMIVHVHYRNESYFLKVIYKNTIDIIYKYGTV